MSNNTIINDDIIRKFVEDFLEIEYKNRYYLMISVYTQLYITPEKKTFTIKMEPRGFFRNRLYKKLRRFLSKKLYSCDIVVNEDLNYPGIKQIEISPLLSIDIRKEKIKNIMKKIHG
jgi:hypothetical protein